MNRNNFELFSEVYGCYFTVVGKILAQARETPLNRSEIDAIVRENAFYESAFHLLPRLFSGEWDLLAQAGKDAYAPKTTNFSGKRPLTGLELSWLKALLLDRRIRLFFGDEEYKTVTAALADAEPLYTGKEFHVFDAACDGDPYEDETYINNFRKVLAACKEGRPIRLHYQSGKQNRSVQDVFPCKINFCAKDDKFRLMGLAPRREGRFQPVLFNCARIISVEAAEINLPPDFDPEKYPFQRIASKPITLRITRERNALERFMFQFASWEKHTVYDEASDCYLCRLFYDPQDETDLLIRIFGFGPVIKVLGPPNFVKQMKARIDRQFGLNCEQEHL